MARTETWQQKRRQRDHCRLAKRRPERAGEGIRRCASAARENPTVIFDSDEPNVRKKEICFFVFMFATFREIQKPHIRESASTCCCITLPPIFFSASL
jgi:hypothetical protein